MNPVVIIGSGGHAKVVISILQAVSGYEIIGCIADDTDPTRLVSGIPIIGPMDRIESLHAEGLLAAIGIGGWTDNDARRQAFERAVNAKVEIVSAIHPAAVIAPTAQIGTGNVIFAGAVINSEAVLGNNVIVATNSSVDHESRVGDHCLISAGVVIGANTQIGSGALIAIGSVVASRITIGAGCLVSAGAVVVDDVASGAVVFGVPARSRLSSER